MRPSLSTRKAWKMWWSGSPGAPASAFGRPAGRRRRAPGASVHRLPPAPPSPSLSTAQPRANAMAIYSWRESIRQGGVLKVFQTESFTGSTWVTELEPSIKTLNALLKKHGFKLKFETTDTKTDA